MKVTYIDHSGFMVELEKAVLLFDYAQGTLPQLPMEKPLAIFLSHSHRDHFNWEILEMGDRQQPVHFFFGNDIRLGSRWLRERGLDPEAVKEKVTKMTGGRSFTWESIAVHTLTSTDRGVAFIVEAEGKRIYHAGDLNWWSWNGEPQEENLNMGAAYRKQIDTLSGKQFDLAFVPLDPRLEDGCRLGMDFF